MTAIEPQKLAGCIDHTILKPDAVEDDIKRLCSEAVEHGFCTVFVNPRWVSLAADLLVESKVNVGSVVSFPLGADLTKTKVAQASDIIFAGADEVDMVADIAAVIQGDEKYLTKQFNEVLKFCRKMKPAVILKVIIEARLLTDEQKIFICQIANRCGIDYVKTSTGMSAAGGATVEDVKLMKKYAPSCKVKASGGIKTDVQAIEMLSAGADRIGTSASVAIINGLKSSDIQ